MAAPQIDWKAYAEVVMREISMVSGALKEKGSKRFGRVLGVAGFMIFAAYMAVYLPPQTKSARLQSQIEQAKVMAEASAQYKDIRDQLSAAYLDLPPIESRDQWLSNSVRDSLTTSGLVTEEFKPVRESETNGLIYQSSEVTLPIKFGDFFDWLLKIESAKPLLQIQRLDLTKKPDNLGVNSVTCEIATVIPKKRYR